MNKTAIKNYAIWARVNLIEAAKQKAFEYEITENGEMKTGIDSVGGRLLSKAEKEQRNTLIAQIRQKGFNQVMEEVAYTWFNRFIALRFMEVNGYLPSKIRVFTDENGAFKPEILKEATRVELEGIDRDIVIHLLDKQDNEGLYKYLLITQCNALNAALPGMFEKIANYTELLFPNNLLKQDSVIGRMISDIPEEDWTDAVQIIGWLYQYYNSELKDETFALLKKNVKITKERIPAATQLFTPDWIVRYMVENSLGRLWYEGHKNDELKSTWKYYLDEAEQEPEVEEQLKKIRAEYAQIKPEDIKVIDPCMGSGHILVYAFDVLMQIYTSAGWSERDAAKSILENNLYGLDIDDRAGQLAYFAVMMKARKYNRRILTMDIKPWVMSIQDSGFMTDDLIEYVANRNADIRADLRLLRKDLKDAKELGSIINVTKLDYPALYARIAQIEQDFPEDLMKMAHRSDALEKLLPLIKQAQVMSQKYDVVVTNPPYMGRRNTSNKLASFLDSEYPNSKMDLFSAFIEKNGSMCKKNGLNGYMTPFVWLFLSSYTKLRELILQKAAVDSFLQPEESSFQEAAVSICAFIIRNSPLNYIGTYVKMSSFHNSNEQELRFLEAVKNPSCGYVFQTPKVAFADYPDSRFIYWAGKQLRQSFKTGRDLDSVCQPRQGMATTNNDLFLRLWYELDFNRIGFNKTDEDDAFYSGLKWFPYNKGGGFRKWYGNFEYCVNYENKGKTICDYIDNTPGARVGSNGRVINRQFFFKKSITWSDICGSSFAARACPQGFIFDVKGSSAFVAEDKYYYILALLNSDVCVALLNTINPTVTTQVGDLKQLPFIADDKCKDKIETITEKTITESKDDWDSFENSWDFKRHPLI